MTDTGSKDTLTVEICDNALVVHGDIDIAGGPVLDAALVSLEAERPIIIDLADVSFIDSSGLRSLLGASRRAKARDAVVVLRDVGPEIIRILQITGTTDQFSIETTRD